MDNSVLRGEQSRQEIKKGIDLVANTVKITLGPRGRNVLLDTDPFSPLNITNDGVTIAREIIGETREEKSGAKLVKEVAGKTNDIAGDGTTTATLLFQSIVTYAMNLLANNGDAVMIRRGIEHAAEQIIKSINNEKVETKDLKSLISVATISCGDPKIGKIIGEAIYKVGSDGLVTIEDSETEDTSYHITKGLELRGGIEQPVFVTNRAKQEAQLDKTPVFVTDHDITNGIEAVKIMEVCAEHGYKHAVVIANSVNGEALAACILNKLKGKFNLTPIRVVAWGNQGQEILRDVSSATEATFFSKDEGYKLPTTSEEKMDWENFGLAGRVVATRERTTILDGSGDRSKRIKELRAQLPNMKKAFEKEAVKERIARLAAGVGIVRVGGVTETEKEERRARVEDAINATKAALREGIIAGGGTPLYRAACSIINSCANDDPSFKAGFMAVARACKDPMEQMAINSGLRLDRGDLKRVQDNATLTIDFNTGIVVRFQEKGIIDPLLVVVTALKNAASTAALFITTEASVVALEDKSEKL